MDSLIRELAHLHIPLEDVRKATHDFAPKNIIGKGGFGFVYKGQLLRSGQLIKISARRLDRRHGHGDVEFWTEVSVLSNLQHENIVSMIGFCDENGEKIIIYHRYPKGSLLMYLSNPSLTWTQRLRICVGVARALSYINNEDGRSYAVLHRNINSFTILLDDKFAAKLSGFEYSIKYSLYRKDQVLLSEAIGTTGYMDPSVQKSGGVTHKSDIYSFGVVLWEILCGRKAFIPNEDEDKRFLASLVRFHYENRTLNDIIQSDLRNQMALESLTSFSKVAYSCLKDERVQRPDINSIVQELEKALELHLPYEDMRKKFERLKIQLGDLRIRLNDIQLATENFSESYQFEVTRFYNLYRAEPKHYDKVNPSTVGRKRHSSVVIKRIRPREDDRGDVFFTEIVMLTTCKHDNIASLLGYCDEDSEMILVIEQVSNGYLNDYLKNIEDKPILTWAKRLKICLDVARALKYLHTEMEGQNTIIHRDITSASIAVDDNWGAKIVDFGLSVFLPPNQDDDALYHKYINGTNNYIDPEYTKTGKLKRESDVYSFGVVLFEVLCGRVASDKIYMKESKQGLAHVVRRNINEGLIEEMVDSVIKEESGLNKYSLDTFIEIASECVAETQDQRPTMNVVVNGLEHALLLQEESEGIQGNQDDVATSPSPVDLVKDNMKHIKTIMRKEKMRQRFGPKRPYSSSVADANEILPQLKQNLRRAFMDGILRDLKNMDAFTLGGKSHEERGLHRSVDPTIELKLTRQNLENKLEHLKIPLSELQLATDNFSEAYLTQTTNYYNTYKAELDFSNKLKRSSIEGNTVIIKRVIPREDKQGEEVFFIELEMLSKCKHRNIATLVGFCDGDSELILVIEHASNGYLYDYLENIKDKPILTWDKRLKICLDVARGLKYLHYMMEDQETIINRGIGSHNIVLDNKWVAKIRFFGFSVLLSPNEDYEDLHPNTIVRMNKYTDPEYRKTGNLKRESDVYSFGLVLFEILFGKVAYDPTYIKEGRKGLASVARRGFHEGTLMEMIDPILMEGSGDYSFTLNRGPNKNSLVKFIKIAYKCLAETQDKRPTMKVVVKELEKALYFQENNKDDPRIPLEDITKATRKFHPENCIGGGGFGNVYKGIVPQGDGLNTIVAKRLDTRRGQGEQQFRNEIQILFEYKHENVIRLVGYCDEKDAKVIVYEYASLGSLDKYLNDVRLTWMKRLNICVDVANALEFLHGGVATQAAVIHRDIKTSNILLNDVWKAKLADFGLSLICAINKETRYVIDRACGTQGYVDPLYRNSGFLTMESDIYSFGVVLFEILCGRSTFRIHKDEGQFLPSFIKQKFEEGKHDEVVFEAIKAQIVPKALTTFQRIAYRCLHDDRENRPTAKEVLKQLKKALKFQADFNR